MTGPAPAPPPPPANTASHDNPGRLMSVGQILGGILLVLVVIFIAENTRSVPIRFVFGPEVDVPVYLALLIAAVVGGLIGSLLRYRRKRNHKN